jgi:hypothetical protein
MATMTDTDPPGSTPPGKATARPRPPEPDASRPAEDPGYLTESGEAVGEDGSVVPIIGGLPAAAGSAWDIGAPADERGADLADVLGRPPDQASDEDPRSS